MNDVQAIKQALFEALEHAMGVYQDNRKGEDPLNLSLSTAHDQGRIDGLREAIEIVENLSHPRGDL